MPDNIGSQADPAVTDSTAAATVTAALKGLLSLAATIDADTGTIDADTARILIALAGPYASSPYVIASYNTAAVDLAAATANQQLVAAPAEGTAIWVFGMVLVAAGGDATVTLQDEDDTAHSGTIDLQDGSGFVLNPSGSFYQPWIQLADTKALEADTAGAGTVDGIITYAIVNTP